MRLEIEDIYEERDLRCTQQEKSVYYFLKFIQFGKEMVLR